MTYAEWKAEIIDRRMSGASVTAIAQWNHQHGPRTQGTREIRAVLQSAGLLGTPSHA